MKYISSLKYIQLSIISVVWILIFGIPLIFAQSIDGINWNLIRKMWIEYLFLFVVFLINRKVLIPQLFFKGKRITYFISATALILIFFIGMYQFHLVQNVFNDIIPQHEPFMPPPVKGPIVPAFANLLILSVLVLGFDTGLIISISFISSENEKNRLEKENTENKLAFLKNQISPHFFMNTLNNIHALVDINSNQAKDAVIKLSKLMKHLLYESENNNITILKEIEFIKSYIDLMKLRFNEKVEINLSIENNTIDKGIPPLLFISFIENAFKHGISYNKKSFINISLIFNEDEIDFKIVNSNHSKDYKESNSGIGLENSKKRLSIIYPNTHRLNIESNDEIYIVNLNIKYD